MVSRRARVTPSLATRSCSMCGHLHPFVTSDPPIHCMILLIQYIFIYFILACFQTSDFNAGLQVSISCQGSDTSIWTSSIRSSKSLVSSWQISTLERLDTNSFYDTVSTLCTTFVFAYTVSCLQVVRLLELGSFLHLKDLKFCTEEPPLVVSTRLPELREFQLGHQHVYRVDPTSIWQEVLRKRQQTDTEAVITSSLVVT